jgi:DNA-binding response OmpR family regulator
LAKFNVLTAFSAAEMLATAKRFDADGFIVDSVMVEPEPCELCADLRRLRPGKPLIVVGDPEGTGADHVVIANDAGALLECAVRVFGEPRVVVVAASEEEEAERA